MLINSIPVAKAVTSITCVRSSAGELVEHLFFDYVVIVVDAGRNSQGTEE